MERVKTELSLRKMWAVPLLVMDVGIYHEAFVISCRVAADGRRIAMSLMAGSLHRDWRRRGDRP